MPYRKSSEEQTWLLSPDLLGFADNQGRFVETNPAWQTVLGWTKPEILERIYLDFLHPDDVAPTAQVRPASWMRKLALHFQNRYLCKDGSYKWLSWVAIKEGDMFFCSARDISEDKARSRALKTSEDEALLRDQFVAILGHDLRNPLAGIGAAVRVASRQPHDEKMAQMFESINASVDRIANLIDVTTDFARARLGGGIPVSMAVHESLEDGFAGTIEEIRMAHPDRALSFSYDFDGPLTCDADRLNQMLSNLVANAVTHGAVDQPIDIAVRRRNGCLVISVTNGGTPIPTDALANLFEPFSKASEDDSMQGLGLGLFISRQIAQAHRGSLDVSSDNTRTRFEFTMPIGRTTAAAG